MTQPVRTAPTLAEVAAAAGVSRSTASRALNDSPRISEETKKRVRAAAKEVNFVPNARGRALAVGRTEIIAVLVTEPLSELFSDPTYSEFLSGITEELSESSYLPVILQASSTHERNRAREHFERRSFDAVIDVSPYKGSELLEVLRELDDDHPTVHYVYVLNDYDEFVAGVHPRFDRAKCERFLANTQLKPNLRVREMSKGMIVQLHLALVMAIDAKLLVTLPVTNNLPLAALIVGAPAVGGALFIADKLLGDRVARFASVQYKVKGPWQEPEISFEKPFEKPR